MSSKVIGLGRSFVRALLTSSFAYALWLWNAAVVVWSERKARSLFVFTCIRSLVTLIVLGYSSMLGSIGKWSFNLRCVAVVSYCLLQPVTCSHAFFEFFVMAMRPQLRLLDAASLHTLWHFSAALSIALCMLFDSLSLIISMFSMVLLTHQPTLEFTYGYPFAADRETEGVCLSCLCVSCAIMLHFMRHLWLPCVFIPP